MKKFILILLVFGSVSANAGAPQRMVAVGGALTEIIYALGAGSALVGNDTTSYYPEDAAKLPKVGYQRALSAEGILSLSPDMIILTDEAGPPSVLAQIESVGIKTEMLHAGRSLEDVKTNIAAIAALLDKEAEGKALIESISWQADALAANRAQQKTHTRVMFILQHGGGAPMVAGENTAADGIIALSGGINVASDYSGYKPLTPESAVALKPDVIVITKRGLEQAGGKSALLSNPALSLTPAGKEGHVIAMDSLLLLGFGPRTIEAATTLYNAY